MNDSNCKYVCLLKGSWKDRFFELIELFQVSLHHRFAIGVPENIDNQFNRIIIYGMAVDEESLAGQDSQPTDDEIFNAFYQPGAGTLVAGRRFSTVSEFANVSREFFEEPISFN